MARVPPMQGAGHQIEKASPIPTVAHELAPQKLHAELEQRGLAFYPYPKGKTR